MMSILIPVYNFEVFTLVEVLSNQALTSDIEFEIVCYDDGSTSAFKQKNKAISQFKGVIYKELETNLGRASIRNLLAKDAVYPYLLFMDCDSQVNTGSYLTTYLNELDPQTLLYGGRSYQLNPPENEAFYFHWFYGSSREVQVPEKRNENPYRSFMTNNFLIPKAIFEKIKFNESIRDYGHEDTLFGLALKQNQIKIKHLDNPLEHIGLEATEHFLGKSDVALKNLHRLSKSYPLENEVKSLRFLKKVKAAGLLKLTIFCYRIFAKRIRKNLYSKNVRLKYFDFYKLAFLAKLELLYNKNKSCK